MTISVETYVDPVPYNRIPDIKNSVHNALREQLKAKNNNLDWTTETITAEYKKGDSNRKCDDRLLITMSVDVKKILKCYLYTRRPATLPSSSSLPQSPRIPPSASTPL